MWAKTRRLSTFLKVSVKTCQNLKQVFSSLHYIFLDILILWALWMFRGEDNKWGSKGRFLGSVRKAFYIFWSPHLLIFFFCSYGLISFISSYFFSDHTFMFLWLSTYSPVGFPRGRTSIIISLQWNSCVRIPIKLHATPVQEAGSKGGIVDKGKWVCTLFVYLTLSPI